MLDGPVLEGLTAMGTVAVAAQVLWLAVRVVAGRERSVPTEPYTLRYELWPREPWRSRPDADTISPLPTWWLHSIVNPGELAAAARHVDRLAGLGPSIAEVGIHTPLVVNIDQIGRVCVADGHHRLVLAIRLQLATCPVQVRVVSRIGGYGVAIGPAVVNLVHQNREGGSLRCRRQ